MDCLHWDSWYQTQASNYFDVMEAWLNADHYVNPVSGQETWTADDTSVYSLTDYNHRVDSSTFDYNYSYAQMMNFENNVNVCP